MEEIQTLLQRYERNGVIRGLVQLIPLGVGSAADVYLVKTLEKIRLERLRTYFDELTDGDAIVDEDLLISEDFLHSFAVTTRLALNTRRREKIQMFARLLKNSVATSNFIGSDELEEFLSILDDLGYREIQALNLLDKFSNTPKLDGQNDLQWINQFWSSFEIELIQLLNISKSEIPDFMNRITRTGCYEVLTGMYWDYTGGKGKLTPTYRRFKKLIMEERARG